MSELVSSDSIPAYILYLSVFGTLMGFLLPVTKADHFFIAELLLADVLSEFGLMLVLLAAIVLGLAAYAATTKKSGAKILVVSAVFFSIPPLLAIYDYDGGFPMGQQFFEPAIGFYVLIISLVLGLVGGFTAKVN